MSRERRELVVIRHQQVLVQGNEHCNNDCPQMEITRASAGAQEWDTRCDLFNARLLWDKRCKYNGYYRTPKCKQQARKP